MEKDMGKIRENPGEIEMADIVRKLYRNRRFIFRVSRIFLVLGILHAFTSASVYTAQCTVVPQITKDASMGGLSGLAAMAGINLGSVNMAKELSPLVYPKIMKNVEFRKELMMTPLKFKKFEYPVSVYDYCTDPKYRSFNLKAFVWKYTVGLPGLILKTLSKEDTLRKSSGPEVGILYVSKKEMQVADFLEKVLTLNVDRKEGIVTLSATLPDPLAAAELTDKTLKLLQKYITEFKIQKVASNLQFVEERYHEVKKNFEDKQEELARFKDANLSFSSATAQIREEKLRSEYTLIYSVYTELAKQLEQSRIAVKETTPILGVVEPVVVPVRPSAPRRMFILVVSVFLGFVLAVGYLFTAPFIAGITGNKRLLKWYKD